MAKKNLLKVEKNENEEMLDAILGADEEMTDELASEILAEYGLDESKLLDNFRTSVRQHLQQIPAESHESKRLGAMLRNVAEYQKASSPEAISPKEWVAGLLGDLVPAQSTPAYSFRERKEGTLPDSDQGILDELKKELAEGNTDSEK